MKVHLSSLNQCCYFTLQNVKISKPYTKTSTRKLSYRKDDRTTRHVYECPENKKSTVPEYAAQNF